MPANSKHNVRFTPEDLPKSEHERLLRLLFNDDLARPCTRGESTGGEPMATRAEAGASQVRQADTSSAPTRPGSANRGAA
jgi:hypothetical protein